MNLWIRSQDKESLTKISNIQYYSANGCHYLGTYYDNLKILGKYKYKSRALEVLDEIQNIFQNGLQANNSNQLCGTTTYVYEIPKEEE